MLQTLALSIVAGYGALALVGGVIGYLKAGSRASLIAGGVSGLVLIGSSLLALSHPVVGLALASLVSLALVARFARGVVGKQRASGVAYVMIGGGLAVLVAAGMALS